MSKFGQAVINNSDLDSDLDSAASKSDIDSLVLKKREAEAEIRMKLDKFAKELSQAKNNRDKH
ncbi:MAG: hypothetical protein AB8B95_11680 [Pseudohongiellaceae bacterium]